MTLHSPDLNKVKDDAEPLDKQNKDNDNDDKRNDKDDDSRVSRPTYYNKTDKCHICNNKFISTTTDIFPKELGIEVTDVGVIYFDKCRHMFHNVCVTKFGCAKDKNKCPRCDSVGSHVDCQSYDEQINLLNDNSAINGNNVKGNDNDNTTTVIVAADNDIYDNKQTYDNEDQCAICRNKFVDATPELLCINAYEEENRANILLVQSLISCKHKFHRLCWMRHEIRQYKEKKLLKCPLCRTTVLYSHCLSKHDCTLDNTTTTAKEITSSVNDDKEMNNDMNNNKDNNNNNDDDDNYDGDNDNDDNGDNDDNYNNNNDDDIVVDDDDGDNDVNKVNINDSNDNKNNHGEEGNLSSSLLFDNSDSDDSDNLFDDSDNETGTEKQEKANRLKLATLILMNNDNN